MLNLIKYYIPCIFWRFISNFKKNNVCKIPISFVIEDADWAIKRVGESIIYEIETFNPNKAFFTKKPARLFNKIVHFGSQYMWVNWNRYMSTSNVFVASYFHGKPEDGIEIERHINDFLESESKLDKIVVSNSIVKNRLVNWGIQESKLVQIPIGVNTQLFRPCSHLQKEKIREKLGFFKDEIVIGSFQKDGIGWNDGLKPKLIKGPDILVEVLKQLRKNINVSVLLTGPARGYVKKNLDEMKIKYKHVYLKNYNDLASYYHSLDLYLITSREEGGPMGLMESLSSGVPVVTTDVGMSPDLIVNKENGFLIKSYDPIKICEKIIQLTKYTDFKKMSSKSREVAKTVDWNNVAYKHWEYVYKPLLKKIS